MRSKTSSKILLILMVFIIAAILFSSFWSNFKIENNLLNWSIRVVLIALIIGLLIYAVRKGTFTRTLKKVLRETAEKTGLEIGRPAEKLAAPLECFMILQGKYKGHDFKIKPFNSITGPIGSRMTSLIVWGYFDLYIEIGPFQINHNHPEVKKESGRQVILLPEELKQMPYDFHDDAIRVFPDKLRLIVEYKCPKSSEELIKVLNILANIANNIKI